MWKISKMLVASLFIFLTYPVPASFASKAGAIPFEVSPILPDNQHGDVRGYFDLDAVPGQKDKIFIMAKNLKDHQITVKITPFNAMTSNNGEIIYDVKAKEDRFIELQADFKKHIQNENQIVIPAKSSVKIPFEISHPDAAKGMALGGIHVIAENEAISEEKIEQEHSTFQIKNQIAYVIGLKIQYPEKAEPDFSFGDVRLDILDGKPKLVLEMKNSAPAVIKNAKIQYSVADKRGTVILDGTLPEVGMAPNTKFDYPVQWLDGEIKSGEYEISLAAEYGGKQITDTKQLAVEKTDDVKEFNKQTKAEAADTGIAWWNYLLTALNAIVIFLFVARRLKKRK